MLRNVQLLRAIAALGVVVAHTSILNSILATSFVQKINGYQYVAGVDLFFVISGFIMIYITRDGARPGTFLLARAARIYPLWWVLSLAAAPATVLVLVGYPHEQAGYLVRSLFLLPTSVNAQGELYLPPVGAGWTLIYEMFFYLVFALALATGPRLLSLKASAALLACYGIGFLLPDRSLAKVFLGNAVYLEFIFGMAIAEVYFARRFDWLAVAALIAAATYLRWYPSADNATYRAIWWGVPSAALLMLALALERLRIRAPQFLAFFGDAAYATYLAQNYTVFVVPIYLYMLLGPLTPWAWVPVIIVVTQAIGCIGYVLLDRPAHNAARRLVRHFTRTSDDLDRAPRAGVVETRPGPPTENPVHGA